MKRILLLRAAIAAVLLLWTIGAQAADVGSWTKKPDGTGGDCRFKNSGAACYWAVTNPDDDNTSPVLTNGSQCGQIFTRFDEVSGTCDIDIRATDPKRTMDPVVLPNGANLTADALGPSGGITAAIDVLVNEGTTCVLIVEAVCSEN